MAFRFVPNPAFETELMASPMMRGFAGKLAELVAVSARAKAPIRLGILREGIEDETYRDDGSLTTAGGWVGRVSSRDWKTMLIEHGTRRMRARPFLMPALIETLPDATIRGGRR